DIKTNPTSGYYLDGEIVPFVGISGGDPGVQINIDARGYKALGSSDRVVLAGRVQLGSIIGPDPSDVSPTFLYFSGGAGSVRGQEYQSLGIDTPGGTAGGRSYLALSGEVRGRITDSISLVGFYDVGFVDQNSFISGDSEYHAGAGIGLRYDVTGIGPIRLDLAMPVSGDTDDGLQFYIGIGQAF
ncbi:MAG: BamA/TamA family outer membrane protein, partial [Tritonibacter mobilis]|nr:BamA/TamA family outer membrane protein [Tritonibacter mobilis]